MPKSLQTAWYNKTIDALQMAGMSESTQESYAQADRMLFEHFEKNPRQITEGELQAYFLYRRNETRWSASTLKICYCALKIFFINVLQRDWHLFKIMKAQPEKRLPRVLSRNEFYHIFRNMKTFHNFVFLATVYSCGLRLQEALFLEVSDIDSHRTIAS